jgi:hypothetical protein
MFRFFFLAAWSGEEKLSAAVLYGGLSSIFFSTWGVWRTVLDDCIMDALSVNLYVFASASGIAAFTFGTWLVFRHIGFATFRWLAFVFGVIGVSVWPVVDYVCR